MSSRVEEGIDKLFLNFTETVLDTAILKPET